MKAKAAFLNFQVDHMTLLVEPSLYPVAYAVFRIVLGVGAADLLYEKRRALAGGGEVSMTFAARVGRRVRGSQALDNTIIAVVQPSEPSGSPSHVRRMLAEHSASAHWQHIALRTPDLLAFHAHASARGVNFITPILRDAEEDLIQVFSGEWFPPGGKPSALFFEFVQRDPSASLLRKLKERNRQSWFRDAVFLGLYGEKEKEYQSGTVVPFIDPALFKRLRALLGAKQVWEISEGDLRAAEKLMLDYAAKRAAAKSRRA